MGIAAIIGIVSSVIQIARSFNAPETPQAAQPQQKADKLFAELDAMGRGAIEPADLEKAFDRIGDKATAGAERLFAKLDADGSGAISREEFTGSINRVADQLDQHFHRLRLHGEGNPSPAAEAGFTREELAGQLSSVAGNFDQADANGDGRVSLKEARDLRRHRRRRRLPAGSRGDNVETDAAGGAPDAGLRHRRRHHRYGRQFGRTEGVGQGLKKSDAVLRRLTFLQPPVAAVLQRDGAAAEQAIEVLAHDGALAPLEEGLRLARLAVDDAGGDDVLHRARLGE
jgi:hypothetical protein